MLGAGRDLCGSSSPTPCQSRVTYSRLHRTSSRRVLNISREGDSTTPLGSLFQGSVTLRGKKFFLMFSWNFLCFSLCPLPLVLSLVLVRALQVIAEQKDAYKENTRNDRFALPKPAQHSQLEGRPCNSLRSRTLSGISVILERKTIRIEKVEASPPIASSA